MSEFVRSLSVAVLSILFAFPVESEAADTFWPGWLGPERNGWVPDYQPPATWPQKINTVWQTEVGIGYGSPVVADGLVFQHARQGEEEVVWCFDLKTGDVKWRKSYPVPFKMGGGGEWHGKGPKSCPVYADGRLFTLSITGQLIAWNAQNGDRIWHSEYGKEFDVNHPYWGVSTSPIVDGELIFAHFGNDNRGVLVALDVATGKEIWRNGKDGTSYSSPLLTEIHGVRQIIEWNHEALIGVERSTGQQLWSHPFPHRTHNQNMPTPSIHNGRILLGAENRGVHCLKPELSDGQWTVRKIWQQKDVALDMSSAVINDGLLFGMSHYGKGRLFCLNPKNGDVLWQGPPRVGSNVTFLSVPGHIFALRDNGELQVVRAAGDAYQKVVAWQVADSPTWAPPVLTTNGVLVKDQQHLRFVAFESAP